MFLILFKQGRVIFKKRREFSITIQHYRLIGSLGVEAFIDFQNGDQDSIYRKLYEHKMFGVKSFVSTDNGLKRLEKDDKVAFLTNGANVRARKDYHCKVN